MANLEQIAKLDEGVEVWNKWRASQTITPDLSDVDFSSKDLSRADLQRADLRSVFFNGTNLSGAILREANLLGADLSGAKGGLQTEQLAGADLTGAKLPEELTKLYDKLENVNNISESARKLFLAVLAACLYSWLTIATTTDVNLITNRASSPLPIIQTSIPIVGFYWVAPLLLLCVYFYFHFYLQKLWEELGSLPAIFPDGRPLHAKIDPWLLNDLVRAHLPKLKVDRPFLSYLQLWISVLLAWWVVPITMVFFWGRYLQRHERTGTTFHVVLLAISLGAALRLYRLALATLRGTRRGPFRWRSMSANRRGYQTAPFVAAAGVLFGLVSWGAMAGVPSDKPILGVPLLLRRSKQERFPIYRPERGGVTWVPRLMALVGYSPFADLTDAEISQKKPTWSKKDEGLDSVAGAQLKRANLRYALASGAFLAGAHLDEADLSGADLGNADLKGSHLRFADLSSALLDGADLSHADLSHAGLSSANLGGALLTLANLRDANLHNADLSGANLSRTILDDADLSHADLSSAHLSEALLALADLRDANLHNADLSGANLNGAALNGAVLRDADLRGTVLDGADLTYSIFRGEKVSSETVKQAVHWEKAFYDDKMIKALGLASDHNIKLDEQRKKEEALQKQNAGKTEPLAAPQRN